MGCMVSGPAKVSYAAEDDGPPGETGTGTGSVMSGAGSLIGTFASEGSKQVDNVSALFEFEEPSLERRKTGMGKCFSLVTRRSDGRELAVKQFAMDGMAAPLREALRGEARTLQSLSHPHIIRVYDVFESDTELCIVCERCTGGHFRERVMRQRLGPVQAPRLVRMMLGAVLYLHESGVTHDYLRMENFVFENRARDSDLKLCDLSPTNDYLRGPNPHGHRSSDAWSMGAITYMLLGMDYWHSIGVRERDKWDELREGPAGPGFRVPEDFAEPGVSDDAKDFITKLLMHDGAGLPQDIMMHPFLAAAAEAAASPAKGAFPYGDGEPFPLALGSDESLGKRVQEYVAASPFLQMVRACVAHTLANETLAPLKKRFLAMDENGDGVISSDEFEKAMRKEGYGTDFVHSMFSALDKNGDNSLDYLEFLAASLEPETYTDEENLRAAFRV